MDLLPVCGIYKIQNKENGRVYIGKSVYILKRWCEHISLLIEGKHHTPLLQEDFIKFGLDSLEFSIITTCTRNELKALEGLYLIACRDSGAEMYNTTFPKVS